MKKSKIAILAVSLFALAACGRVAPGNEGVVVNLYGDGKGVDAKTVSTGWHFYGMGKELYQFPLFKQNIEFVEENNISFQDRDGLQLRADIGMTYFVEKGSSANLFQQYRRGIEEITQVFIKNMIRDEFNRISSTMSAEEIYSTRKNQIIDAVEGTVREKVAVYGIVLEELYWVSAIQLPTQVKESINNKIEATQIAAQRRNEVATAEAEADKKVETSRGLAQSILLEAEARAKAIELEGKAIEEYPQVLKLREIAKWNGAMPTTLVTDGENTSYLISPNK